MPARLDASPETPSCRQPSPAITQVGAEEAGARAVQRLVATGGEGESDGRGDALAEGTGAHLDAGRVVKLGVAGGARPEGAAEGELVEPQAVAGQRELHVEQQAGVAGREHEAVAAGPLGVGGVVAEHVLEQRVREGSQRHRRAGVAVALRLDHLRGDHDRGGDGTGLEGIGLGGRVAARGGGCGGGSDAVGRGLTASVCRGSRGDVVGHGPTFVYT